MPVLTIKTEAVLFDLDGTLLDTAPDLAGALNRMRNLDGLNELAFEEIRPWGSHGSVALLRLGYGLVPEDREFAQKREQFLAEYRANIAEHSRMFDGVEEILNQLEASGRKWGIVTNKPHWLTTPLLEALKLSERAACIVSGDSTAHAKPHPEPLITAANQLDISTHDCLYVGDAERDVQAAKAASMPVVIAQYG